MRLKLGFYLLLHIFFNLYYPFHAWLFTLPTALRHRQHCKAEVHASIENNKFMKIKDVFAITTMTGRDGMGVIERGRERETQIANDLIGVVKEL